MTVESQHQILLNIIQNALSNHIHDPQFKEKSSLIKSLFFHRKYLDIFSNPSLLGIYAAEYIPHRALCYTELFSTLECLDLNSHSHITCLGSGNGAEFMGLLMSRHTLSLQKNPLSIHSHDLADYGILDDLALAFKQVFPQDLDHVSFDSITCNVISDPLSSLMDKITQSSLITCMFLLNELFCTSKSGFAQFLMTLIQSMSIHSLLLIVDSAGSFSEAQIGVHSHMIYRFLDGIQCLECLYSSDSVWYRLPKNLNYPHKLNNMRYYIRVFKKKVI